MNANYTTKEVSTSDLQRGDLILDAHTGLIYEVLTVERDHGFPGAWTGLTVYPLRGGLREQSNLICPPGTTQQKVTLL